MKICLITEYFYPDNTGSTGAVLSELARTLKDSYPDVSIDAITSKHLYRGGSGDLASHEHWDGINITRIGAPRTKRECTMLRLLTGLWFSLLVFFRLVVRPKYDVVLVVTNPPLLPVAAYWLSKLRHTPYVYLIHDLYPDTAIALKAVSKNGFATRLGRKNQRKWLHAARKVIVLGRCMEKRLGQIYGLPEGQMETITNWANPDQISTTITESRFRKKHGLDGFIALYAGNIGPFQGLDIIFDAAKIASKKDSDVLFLVVGNGMLWERMEQRIKCENITNVRLFPTVSGKDYPDLLAAADVCMIPLAPGIDGLAVPSKFYTILAAGKPSVAVMDKDSEVSRVIVESECGLQVNHKCAKHLADAIIKLHDSPDLVGHMGRNARAAFESRFTVSRIAKQYYDVFTEVTGATVEWPEIRTSSDQ